MSASALRELADAMEFELHAVKSRGGLRVTSRRYQCGECESWLSVGELAFGHDCEVGG